MEAVKLASSRLTDFKGRSRRSEFWWWMFLVIILQEVLSVFFGNLYVAATVATLVMFLGLGVTVRRLQDTGHSAVWVYVSYLLGIVYQFYMASSTFMHKLTEMASSADFDVDKIVKLAEKSAGEMGILSMVSLAWTIVSLVVIVFCLIDGKPEANKYGESPKYYEA